MGIKSLLPLINRVAGDYAVKNYQLDDFSGMKVAVDASLLIYQIVLGIRSRGGDMTNKEGRITSHLYGIFFKVNNLLKHGIIPIFVFDGKPPLEKEKTIEKRKEIKTKALEAIKDANEDDKKKLQQKTFELTDDVYNDAKQLLELMGIPYIESPGEADVVCAWLSMKRYVKGVSSEDSDILAFGGRYLFRNMTKTDSSAVTVINLERTLKKMGFTMKKFRELCVLLGCDYCSNIPGIGPTRAFNLVSTHNDIQAIFDSLAKEKKTKRYAIDRKCITDALNHFSNATKDLEKEGFKVTRQQLKLSLCKKDSLIDYLYNVHNFSLKTIEDRVNDLTTCHINMSITKENESLYKPTGKQIPITVSSISFSDAEY